MLATRDEIQRRAGSGSNARHGAVNWQRQPKLLQGRLELPQPVRSAMHRAAAMAHRSAAVRPRRAVACEFSRTCVVSKRLASRYSGGPGRNWVKSKCPGWKRINSERYRLFEGPHKSELTESQKTLAKKRQELARVLERLGSPGLTSGIARELLKNATNLERQIAELEQT